MAEEIQGRAKRATYILVPLLGAAATPSFYHLCVSLPEQSCLVFGRSPSAPCTFVRCNNPIILQGDKSLTFVPR